MAAIAGLVDFEGAVDESRFRDALGSFPDRAFGSARVAIRTRCMLGIRPLAADLRPAELDRVVDDGRFLAVGDGRIDDRAALSRRLRDPAISLDCGDSDLLLAAMKRWGATCSVHLTGEFAIALWDDESSTLHIARDPFGGRPIYFARQGSTIAFASSTRVLRRLMGFTPPIDRESMADYIVFGELTNPSATWFEGIEALPPAHRAEVTADALRHFRFWDVPFADGEVLTDLDEIRDDLVRHLHAAVSDRLRSPNVSIQLSGGLDSPSLAVIAKDVIGGSGVSGLTMSHESLFDDPEPSLAMEVGEYVGLPVESIGIGEWRLWDGLSDGSATIPERPGWGPLAAAWREVYRRHAAAGPIALSGDGGDYILTPEAQPFRWWLGRRDFGGAMRAFGSALRSGVRLRTGLRASPAPTIPVPRIPDWLDGDLLRESGITERARDEVLPQRDGEPRAGMAALLARSRIEQELELAHPTVTEVPLGYTLPWFDRRLVDAAAHWTSYPYLEDKFVLREAMAGLLPESVRLRPKTGLPFDPVARMIDSGQAAHLTLSRRDLAGIFDPTYRWSGKCPDGKAGTMWMWCRAVEVALWRRSLG